MNLLSSTRAELAKIVTVRLWWILAIVLFVYVGFTSGALAGVFGAIANTPTDGGQSLVLTDLHLIVYSSASAVGYVFPVLLGSLATTAEYRHQTLTPTFLATPRRARVLGAKALAGAVMGAGYGVVALAASVGVGAAVLGLTGQDPRFDDDLTWVLVARVVLAMALWAVIGVGLGTLIPNQVAVLLIVLAFTQFVEPILRSVSFIWEWTAEVGKFLPGSASDALVGWSVFTSFTTGGATVAALEWWQGGVVLLAIAAVATVIGYFTIWKRDVT